jgi:hypothetical protein
MKRLILRISILAAGGIVLLAIVVGFILMHRPGSLRDWIGAQLQDIANSYLNPQLSFTDLTYQYPLSVSLKNLHLTADDPKHPGHTIDIIACRSAEVSLGEIPQLGKPIVIQEIVLNEPLISAVAIEPRSKKFVGFYNLLRKSNPENTPEDANKPSKKLSDVFKMRLVQIKNGKVVYDPRIEGTVPMTLDQINTVLNIEPVEAGWYTIDTDIARKPVFDLAVKGQVSLDTFSVRDADVRILADLSQEKLDYLPPEIQALLKQYDAKGKLTINVAGDMPVLEPMKGHIKLGVTLDKANLQLSGLKIPIDGLNLASSFGDGTVAVSSLKIAALGGTADLSGAIALNDRLDGDLHLNIAGMVPERLFANAARASQYPAKVGVDLSVAASLKSLFGKAPPKPGEPLAVVGVKDLRVTADDPANPGQAIDVVACKKLDVSISQPIVQGKPVVVDSLVLERPIISAVSVVPGSMRFAGVPNLAQASSAPAPAEDAAATAPAPEPRKLGDFVRVKSLDLTNARIVYDPRIPGTQRMIQDPIDISVKINPKDSGQYLVKTNISRAPVFNLAINGWVDINNPGLQNLDVHLQADVTQGQLDYLPPQIQVLIKETHARGKLDARIATSVSLSDLRRGRAKFDMDIRNFSIEAANRQIPIDELNISARLQDRVVHNTIKLTTLGNEFDLAGTVALNDRLDTDETLQIRNLVLEKLLAKLEPDRPALASSTILNTDLQIQCAGMVAMGAIAPQANEPVVSVNLRNFRLTTDDPMTPGQPLDFVTVERLGVVLPSLPEAGRPVTVDEIVLEHPGIHAISMEPGSKRFAGFCDLQKMFAAPSPASTQESGEGATTQPETTSVRLEKLARVGRVDMTDASLNYNPRIDNTVPMSLDNVSAKINMDSEDGSAYRFDVLVPSKPDFNLEVSGRLDLDDMTLQPLTMGITADFGDGPLSWLPPQVQLIVNRYNPVGSMDVNEETTVPLRDPLSGDFHTDLKMDKFTADISNFHLPLDQVRMPVRFHDNQLEFLDSSSLGGPTLTAFGGTANLMGTVTLNDRLDTTIGLHTDGILIESILACMNPPSKHKLIGAVHLDLNLVNAPVMVVIGRVQHPDVDPASLPSDEPLPLYAQELPAHWGSAHLEISHAYLVGLELVHGVTEYAKQAFQELFEKKQPTQPEEIIPKEYAEVDCTFDRDRVSVSHVYYEGEDMSAGGSGWISLSQNLDLKLTGGLGKGENWLKRAMDSLAYYHIYGSLHNIQYTVNRGDGKPIIVGVKMVAQQANTGIHTGVHYVGVGLNQAGKGIQKAGDFLHGLFNHKKNEEAAQTQPSDQDQPATQQ